MTGMRTGISMLHSNIGMTYRQTEDQDKSVEHLKLAMEYSDDDRSYGSAQNNLAHTYSDLGRDYRDGRRFAQFRIQCSRTFPKQNGDCILRLLNTRFKSGNQSLC